MIILSFFKNLPIDLYQKKFPLIHTTDSRYNCRILKDQTCTKHVRSGDKSKLQLCKIDKNVDFIGAP